VLKREQACKICCTKIHNFTVIKGKTEIIKNVNLHIHCGDLTALIGPNGAGKSTLLKAILGDIKHSGKLMFVDEKDKHTGNPVIGYVPQTLDFDKSSPISVMDLFSACHSNIPVWFRYQKSIRNTAIEALEQVSAEDLIDKRLGSLSGGELQRVLLALAISPIPDLLLLDEPISGIDQKGTELFYDLVSHLREKYDLSIVLISHDFNLISKYANRIVFLNKEVKCVGKPKDVFNNPEFINTFGDIWAKSINSREEEE
jgi:zinc transport system ATP-binding protein